MVEITKLFLYVNAMCNNERILICYVNFFVGCWPKKWVNWIFKEMIFKYCHFVVRLLNKLMRSQMSSNNPMNLYRFYSDYGYC